MTRLAFLAPLAAIALLGAYARSASPGETPEAQAEALYRKGVEAERGGSPSEATELYRRAINADPRHLQSHRAYQRLMLEASKGDELVAKYDKLLDTEPSRALYRYLRARVDPNPEERRKRLEVAASLDPGFFWACYELVPLYVGRGELDKATARAEKARDILAAGGSDDPEVRNTLGDLYLRSGRMADASAQFERAIELKTDFAEPYYNLALLKIAQAAAELVPLYLDAGRLDDAIRSAEKSRDVLLKRGIDDPTIHNTLGKLYVQAERLRDGTGEFEKAVKLKGDFAEAYGNLAKVKLAQKNYDEAEQYFRKALQIQPGFPEARVSLGHLCARSGRLDEAIANYERAVAEKPGYGLAHNDLAVAYYRRGSKWLAMASLQRARACGFPVSLSFERAVKEMLGDEWLTPGKGSKGPNQGGD